MGRRPQRTLTPGMALLYALGITLGVLGLLTSSGIIVWR